MSSEAGIAIIGAGPGGYVAAIRAAQVGLKVCIIEKERQIGGVCLHKGCIPTKFLLHLAYTCNLNKKMTKMGLRAQNVSVNLEEAQRQKAKIINKLSQGLSFLMKKNKIEVVQAEGRIKAVDTIETSLGDIKAKNIIIATGSMPKSLPHITIDGKIILSSDHALELTKIPQSLLIVGGGAIGVEFASIFSAFGCSVSIVEIMPHILPFEDEDVARELSRALKRQGISIHTEASVESVKIEDNKAKVKIKTKAGDVLEQICEKVLIAIGRQPNTEGLGVEKIGIEMKGSFIKTDSFMQTNVSGVFAIGDVVESPQLAHVASAEGIIAVEKIAGRAPPPVDYDAMPVCVYSFPQVARVGLTETEAKKRGLKTKTGKFPFTASGMALVMQEEEGFIKIIEDVGQKKVVGVCIVHQSAVELAGQAVLIKHGKLGAREVARCVMPHPSISEAIVESARSIYETPIHL